MTDTPPPSPAGAAKSKTVFIVLAILFGELGIHNFYIGNTKRGLIQLLVCLLTCFIAAIPLWIWGVVEAFTVKKDANGVDFN
jgi:TM2 domain-containing membrane protein YozV